MASATLISEPEYLKTAFRPDCDYAEGVLLERNVGPKDHSKLQGEVYAWFRERRRALGIAVFPEQRIQVAPCRYRIPDVCVVKRPEPDEQVFTKPPYICVEVLSPEDTFATMQDRFDDYLAMGVTNVWVLNPASKRAWRVTPSGLTEAPDQVLRTEDGRIEMPLGDLFAE